VRWLRTVHTCYSHLFCSQGIDVRAVAADCSNALAFTPFIHTGLFTPVLFTGHRRPCGGCGLFQRAGVHTFHLHRTVHTCSVHRASTSVRWLRTVPTRWRSHLSLTPDCSHLFYSQGIDVRAVAADCSNALALTTEGKVYSWGDGPGTGHGIAPESNFVSIYLHPPPPVNHLLNVCVHCPHWYEALDQSTPPSLLWPLTSSRGATPVQLHTHLFFKMSYAQFILKN